MVGGRQEAYKNPFGIKCDKETKTSFVLLQNGSRILEVVRASSESNCAQQSAFTLRVMYSRSLTYLELGGSDLTNGISQETNQF